MENIKVIQIEIAGKGGICHYTYNLSESLANFMSLELVTAKSYELQEKERNFNIIKIFNRFKSNPLKIAGYFNKLKSSDIVHFQLSQHPFFVMVMIWLTKLGAKNKIVVTSHNIISHENCGFELPVYKQIYKMADKIIVHSFNSKKLLKEIFGLEDNKISVIPHGNYLFFNEEVVNSGVSSNDGKSILFFGYIRKYKGLMYLLKAFAKVKEALPDSKLMIIGKAVEPFEEYQKEIDKLELNTSIEKSLEYVSFETVKDYFNKADLVVLPYLDISQSGILQLAFSFAKPVVVTDVGGLPEAVEEGKNGFIVRPKDVDDLAEKIKVILKDKNLQNKMGEYSLNLAKTKYSWDTIAKTTFDLYNNLYE